MNQSTAWIQIDPKQEAGIRRRLGALGYKTPQIIARSANDSIPTAKRSIAKSVQSIYILRQKDVNETLNPRNGIRATRARPYARLTYRSTHQNIAKWSSHGRSIVSPNREVKSVWTQIPPDPKKGYKAHIMRSHPFIPLAHDPKPFLRTAKSGSFGMFVRTSNDTDAPIRGVAAPDVTQLISNPKVINKMMNETGTRLEKRLEHHIDQALKGNNY